MVKETELEEKAEIFVQEKNLPIKMREPGGPLNFDSEEDDSEELGERQVSNVISQKLNSEIDPLKVLPDKHFLSDPSVAYNSARISSDEEEGLSYMKSKELNTVQVSMHKSRFQSQNNTEDSFSKARKQVSSKNSDSPSSKRQLNLSVRMREGRAAFKAIVEEGANKKQHRVPRIESRMDGEREEFEDRIESRLISNSFVTHNNLPTS